MKPSVPWGAVRATSVRATLLCLLAVAATLLYLWQHAIMVDLGYRIETSRDHLARLTHQRTELLVEVASLSALPRVERIARERLGLIPPRRMQLVQVIPRTPRSTVPGTGPVMLAANTPATP